MKAFAFALQTKIRMYKYFFPIFHFPFLNSSFFTWYIYFFKVMVLSVTISSAITNTVFISIMNTGYSWGARLYSTQYKSCHKQTAIRCDHMFTHLPRRRLHPTVSPWETRDTVSCRRLTEETVFKIYA